MTDILANIIVRKQRDLLDLQKKVTFEQLEARISGCGPTRDFFAAMTQPVGELCVLSEVKKARTQNK